MARKLPKGIRENKGTYEARAMVNGVKICLYGSDLDHLIEEFHQAKEKVKNSIDYRKTMITLNEWFEEWFTEVKAHKVKETSIHPMKNNFKRTFGFYIGSKKLKDIKPLDVQRALNTMEQEGISNSAMREALGRLRECMEFAVGNQMIASNPCLIVEVPWTYKKAKEEIALTQEEQNTLLNEVEDSWYKEMFYFMCLTGVRVGELGGLQWSDIDFSKKCITIRRSLSCSYCNGKKREMLVSPKTVNSTRQIPFLGEMEEVLKSQKEKQKRLKAELGERWRSGEEFSDLVFTTGMGSPCSRYIVDKEVKKVIKRIREKEAVLAVQEQRELKIIRDFHPHTLRHTFATRCFENKMEPKVVQSLLGHSSISITLNIYTHVLDNKMDEEIKKFGVAKTQNDPYSEIDVGKVRITAKSHY
ncbi:site-specific recombinase XerD [Faecalimonas umbilicata]|uniref:Site-specific integrase n=1 Tax=Faecalimonas umbilicata TaxID=1912855 RepID=A0A4R3JN66_9FIRM|nr:site-specific integrase [Faecalimonas umbilicata]TCS67899.1 site-specific recombinase XerD [Faecalimonas umbilicata]GBU05844.1 site-specific integrase [Faecalimonas umbilicata]